MFFAYVDESGDPGSGGSRTYALACVMVEHDDWLNTFDRLISFRRHMRRLFDIPVRAEIKANYLLQNRGAFRTLALSEQARYAVYRQHMRLQPKLGVKTFAVVIDKQKASAQQPSRPADDVAWEWLLQRLERRTHYERTYAALVHDEGDQANVQKRARKAGRAGTAASTFGTGQLKVPFTRLIDDPIPRNSAQSYFLQLADLGAYAAFRHLQPPPQRPVQIVPQSMWDELGSARFTAVKRAAGAPLAIVHN